MRMTTEERFWSKVDKNGPVPAHRSELGPCWVWTAGVHPDGYGIFTFGSRLDRSKKTVLAHRFAFFLQHGRWPEPCGLHHCDHPPCVRWGHIFEGTQLANIADRVAKGRSGHAVGALNGTFTKPEATLRGEAHGYAKFTAEDVVSIRSASGTVREIAGRFGTSPQHVRSIRNRKIWAHL